jgi:hypothetical protein
MTELLGTTGDLLCVIACTSDVPIAYSSFPRRHGQASLSKDIDAPQSPKGGHIWVECATRQGQVTVLIARLEYRSTTIVTVTFA